MHSFLSNVGYGSIVMALAGHDLSHILHLAHLSSFTYGCAVICLSMNLCSQPGSLLNDMMLLGPLYGILGISPISSMLLASSSFLSCRHLIIGDSSPIMSCTT